jgi:hypothetical protein
MAGKIVPPRVLLVLIAIALMLVVVIAVVLGLAAILLQMGDPLPGTVLCWIALGLGILLVADLFFLVLALAVRALSDSDTEERESIAE